MSRRTEVFDDCHHRATVLAATNEAWALCAADLTYCATDDRFRIAVRQLQDARPGLPGAQDYSSSKTSSGGRSDSVPERLLLTEDRSAGDRRQLDDNLRMLARFLDHGSAGPAIQAAHNLRRLVDVWCTRPASDLDRRKALEENRKLEGCQHHQTANIFEPVTRPNTTCGGRLALPLDLCEHCYFCLIRKDRLPTGEAMELRRRLGKDEKERV